MKGLISSEPELITDRSDLSDGVGLKQNSASI